MNESRQIAELKARHAELEEALRVETSKAFPDQTTVADLKKQKLQAKDRIALLEQA